MTKSRDSKSEDSKSEDSKSKNVKPKEANQLNTIKNNKYDANMENSKVIVVNDNQDYIHLIKTNKKVIIFYSDPSTCLACLKYGSFYKRLANKYHKKALFLYTDIAKCGLSLPITPALYSFINGREFLKLDDGVNHKDIKTMITTILKLKL
jgi:hypothetical protein